MSLKERYKSKRKTTKAAEVWRRRSETSTMRHIGVGEELIEEERTGTCDGNEWEPKKENKVAMENEKENANRSTAQQKPKFESLN